MADKRYILCLKEVGSHKFKDLDVIKQKFYGKDYYMASQLTARNLATSKDLTGTDIKVLLFILSQINFENLAICTQAYMAKEMEMSQSQISKALQKLEEMEYIEKRNVSGSNAYYVEPFVARKGKVGVDKNKDSFEDE